MAADLNHGHRQRLRERFEREGLTHFKDHEVLELMLFYAIPRADTNAIAHRLMREFGSLSAVLETEPEMLCKVAGMGKSSALFLHALPAFTRRYYFDRICRDRPVLDSIDAVSDYVKPLMAGRTREVFMVLCLDAQNRVAYPAEVSEGTINQAFVHPRIVVETALRHQAVSVILAHNHPSGSVQPSDADYRLTRRLVQALGAIDISVLDHVIIGNDNHYSFAGAQAMPAYIAP